MSVCKMCNTNVQRGKGVLGSSCNQVFHTGCVNLKDCDLEFLKSQKRTWNCPGCISKSKSLPSVERPLTPSKKEPFLSEDSALQQLISRLDKIHEDQQGIKSTINSIHEAMASQDDRLKNIEERLCKIEDSVSAVRQENESLKKQVKELEAKVNRLDQDSRRNNIEIIGIPNKPGETVEGIVLSVGLALGIKLTVEDIDYAHRLRPRLVTSDHPPPPGIMVRFVRASLRNEIVRLKKVKRNLTTRDLGWTDVEVHNIYVNESLTLHHKKLYAAARALQKDNKIKYVWVNGGRVLCRKESGGEVVLIEDATHLNRYK